MNLKLAFKCKPQLARCTGPELQWDLYSWLEMEPYFVQIWSKYELCSVWCCVNTSSSHYSCSMRIWVRVWRCTGTALHCQLLSVVCRYLERFKYLYKTFLSKRKHKNTSVKQQHLARGFHPSFLALVSGTEDGQKWSVRWWIEMKGLIRQKINNASILRPEN